MPVGQAPAGATGLESGREQLKREPGQAPEQASRRAHGHCHYLPFSRYVTSSSDGSGRPSRVAG